MTCTSSRAGRHRSWRVFGLVGHESATFYASIIGIDLCNCVLEVAVAAYIAGTVARSNTAGTVHDVRVGNVATAG